MKIILSLLITLPLVLSIHEWGCDFDDTQEQISGCSITKYKDLWILKANNLIWNDEETVIDLPSRTTNITVNPFSPSQVWLGEEGNIIGMSSSESFVLIHTNKGNYNSSKLTQVLTRVLQFETFQYAANKTEAEMPAVNEPEPIDENLGCGGGYGNPCPEGYMKQHQYKKMPDNFNLYDGEKVHMIEVDWLGYLHNHVYDHQNIIDWITNQYFDDDNPATSPMGYESTRKWFRKTILQRTRNGACWLGPREEVNYIVECDGNLVGMNVFEDLSHNADAKKCSEVYRFNANHNRTWVDWMHKHGPYKNRGGGPGDWKSEVEFFSEQELWDYVCAHNDEHHDI